MMPAEWAALTVCLVVFAVGFGLVIDESRNAIRYIRARRDARRRNQAHPWRR